MKYCANCGNQLDDNVKFCPVCGCKQPDTVIDKEDDEEKPTPTPEKDNKKIIIISSIIGAAVLIIAAVIICFIFLKKDKKSVQETTTTEATTTEATTKEATTTEEPTTEDPIELENIAAKKAYYDMISDIVTGAVAYSSDTVSCIDESDPYSYLIYNNYAIEDFDSDGVVELMVYSEWNASSNGDSYSYGENLYFYEYDAEKASVETIHSTSGELGNIDGDSVIFYDNGVIEFKENDSETLGDGGTFVCANTGILDIMGYNDYDGIYEYEINGEMWTYLISISKGEDGVYYLSFVTNFEIDYMYELSETEAKEYLDKLRDADTIDAEVCDFNMEELADVCGFDYDEAVTQIEANTPAIDYDAMYGDIIYKYKELVEEGADYYDIIGEDYPYETDENCSLCYSVAIGDTSGEIGYLISDLDGDGISELVIGVCDDPFVIDVYTIRDGSVVRILDSGERYASFYCGDGVFYQGGSSGWAYYSCGLYQMNSGRMTFLETVFTEPKDENDGDSALLYYYSTISAFEPENATEISEDEYNKKIDEFSSKWCSLTGVTPLSEY